MGPTLNVPGKKILLLGSVWSFEIRYEAPTTIKSPGGIEKIGDLVFTSVPGAGALTEYFLTDDYQGVNEKYWGSINNRIYFLDNGDVNRPYEYLLVPNRDDVILRGAIIQTNIGYRRQLRLITAHST